MGIISPKFGVNIKNMWVATTYLTSISHRIHEKYVSCHHLVSVASPRRAPFFHSTHFFVAIHFGGAPERGKGKKVNPQHAKPVLKLLGKHTKKSQGIIWNQKQKSNFNSSFRFCRCFCSSPTLGFLLKFKTCATHPMLDNWWSFTCVRI